MLDDIETDAPSSRNIRLIECVVDGGVAVALRYLICCRIESCHLYDSNRLGFGVSHLEVRFPESRARKAGGAPYCNLAASTRHVSSVRQAPPDTEGCHLFKIARQLLRGRLPATLRSMCSQGCGRVRIRAGPKIIECKLIFPRLLRGGARSLFDLEQHDVLSLSHCSRQVVFPCSCNGPLG